MQPQISVPLCLLIFFTIVQTGELYLSDNEHIIEFEENLEAYYINAKTLQQYSKHLTKLCNKNPKIQDCIQSLEEITEAAIRETQYIQMNKRSKRELLCFLVATIAITISTAVIAFVSGVAAGAYANNEVVEQHNFWLILQQTWNTYSCRLAVATAEAAYDRRYFDAYNIERTIHSIVLLR